RCGCRFPRRSCRSWGSHSALRSAVCSATAPSTSLPSPRRLRWRHRSDAAPPLLRRALRRPARARRPRPRAEGGARGRGLTLKENDMHSTLTTALPGSWLASRLGADAREIERLRERGELIAVYDQGEWLYPVWQFGPGGSVPAGVREAVKAAR